MARLALGKLGLKVLLRNDEELILVAQSLLTGLTRQPRCILLVDQLLLRSLARDGFRNFLFAQVSG